MRSFSAIIFQSKSLIKFMDLSFLSNLLLLKIFIMSSENNSSSSALVKNTISLSYNNSSMSCILFAIIFTPDASPSSNLNEIIGCAALTLGIGTTDKSIDETTTGISS